MPRSCFISYASEDHGFAEQLHADLLANNCEPWFAPESLRMGDRFQEGIEDAIRQYEKVIVVVSEASLKSRWVEREVLAARDREDMENRAVLIPIKIDDAIAKARQPWAAEFRRTRHIGDFTRWEDPSTYQRTLSRLLRDLKSERPKPSADVKLLPQDQLSRNRRQMIARVRHDWIEGVLQQSLFQVARIDLGFEDRPDLLDRPLTLVVQESQRTARMLPARTKILTVFNEHADAGGLLILGAPGSGKTTLLLELARELLDRADADESHPIPVVFNLSSWALRCAPLAEWLVNELSQLYTVPRRVAQQWVDDAQILPLLDGLDEVADEHQQACVERINEFRSQQFLPVIVCSRMLEYENLSERLRLPAAIAVQALTKEETQEYLASGGERLVGVRKALAQDPTLWELLDSPLMLSLAMLAYRDRGGEETAGESLESRRRHLWAKYVESMFERRNQDIPYTQEQTSQWLRWLARSMKRLGQGVFQLETLNQGWLQTSGQRLTWIWSLALLGLLLGGGIGELRFAQRVTGNPLIPGQRWGDLILGVVFACLLLVRNLKPVDSIKWSRSSFSNLVGAAGTMAVTFGLVGSGLGAVMGVFGVGPFVSGAGLVGTLGVTVASSLGLGLIGMVVGVLYGLMEEGIGTAEIDIRVVPNQGTWRSGRNARNVYFMAIGIGAAGGLILNPMGLLLFGLEGGLPTGITYGLSFGFLLAINKGGAFFVQHWCTRFLLWCNGCAPFQYVRFLDYAAERIFLRKVGGGYIFVHRMLLEYFASLDAPHDPRAFQDRGQLGQLRRT
jgi:hypothetical protein